MYVDISYVLQTELVLCHTLKGGVLNSAPAADPSTSFCLQPCATRAVSLAPNGLRRRTSQLFLLECDYDCARIF